MFTLKIKNEELNMGWQLHHFVNNSYHRHVGGILVAAG